MIRALRLLADALTLKTPPRALLWGLLNKVNYLSRTGNRRYEFERLYLATSDPWDFRNSDYEGAKYRHILARAIEWRRGGSAALEVGCSIGVFSRLLADHFDTVSAVDVSLEAIASARLQYESVANLTFLRQDVRRLNLGRTFDVLFCAEVLYYLPRRAGPGMCDVLDRHLADGGVIVLVSGLDVGQESFLNFDDWKSILRARFTGLFTEVVDDPRRPYELTIFARSGQVPAPIRSD